MMCGGPSDVKDATDDIKQIANNVRSDVETKMDGKSITEFTATHYRSQVVAGTNYFIKVSLGGDNYIHLRVFKPLPHVGEKEELVSVLWDKKASDILEYF